MTSEDAQQQARSKFLQGVFDLTDGRVDQAVAVADVASRIDMPDADAAAASKWLTSNGYLARPTFLLVSLTAKGVEGLSETQGEPAEPPAGLAPLGPINIHGNVYGNVGNVNQGSHTVNVDNSPSVWQQYKIQIVGGTIAAVLGALLVWWIFANLGADDQVRQPPPSESPRPTATAAEAGSGAGFVRCGSGQCAVLRISGTVRDGIDEGVFVRSGPRRDATRLTGAVVDDRIYGLCVAQGMEIADPDLGITSRQWIKSPFKFVPGDLGPGDVFKDPKSHSDTAARRYGWISAVYLSPKDLLRRLPACSG